MPLGDSITETTCVTPVLFDMLRGSGHTDFDFVGSVKNQQACEVTDPDRDCEGHSGYLVTDLVGTGPHASELMRWCQSARADIVLMHFGTNDVWGHEDISIDQILSAYSTVIEALRAAQPNVIIFVAQIIPLEPNNGCASCGMRSEALNREIPAWAASESTAASPIYVVDQWTGFDTSTYTGDGVHPNLAGSKVMAGVWLEALRDHGFFR